MDLGQEKLNGDFVRALITAGAITAAHDISDGGLLVAVAKMALSGGIGARLETPAAGDGASAGFEMFFGEAQARYILTCASGGYAEIVADAHRRGVAVGRIGVTGGSSLTLPDGTPISVAELKKAHDSWLPDYMAGKVQ